MAIEPIAGYRSRQEAVAALRARGHSYDEIAAHLGITRRDVPAYAYKARQRGGACRLSIDLRDDVLTGLAEPARRRSLSSAQLAEQLLRVIAAEPHLADSIMDDGA